MTKYPQLLTSLRGIGEPRVLRKKTSIAFQGEVPRYAYYILDGAIKAYVIGPDGSQTIVDIYAKHSILPLAWLNRTAATALFYYEALTDVRVIRFKREDFERERAASLGIQTELANYLVDSQTSLLFRTAGLCQGSSGNKVCYALYFLLYRYGIEQSEGQFMIPIPLTHEVIANFIGQSRENTAKTIKSLSDEGVLSYESKIYTVNTSRLERYLGEDTFREIVG